MPSKDLNRREFNTLAAAAFGGVIAGTVAGCGKKTGKTDKTDKKTPGGDNVAGKDADLHACKGLNTCQGKGKEGDNKCGGLGTTCATTKDHSCHKENDCSGQGGCDGKAGTNDCKGQGGCESPVVKGKWAAAKDAFDKKHSYGEYAKAKKKTG